MTWIFKAFFVFRLLTLQPAAHLPDICDPDPLISYQLMDDRETFLTFARDRLCEFSSLRWVKISSMAMLFELHNQTQDRFAYTCNSCQTHTEIRFHCTVCEDYDLCTYCQENEGHPHKMDKFSSKLDDGTAPRDPTRNNDPQESGVQSIQRCIQSLLHASQCPDPVCTLGTCSKMKRVLIHSNTCGKKSSGGYSICKQLIALCCYHAKQCNEQDCLVPFF